MIVFYNLWLQNKESSFGYFCFWYHYRIPAPKWMTRQ